MARVGVARTFLSAEEDASNITGRVARTFLSAEEHASSITGRVARAFLSAYPGPATLQGWTNYLYNYVSVAMETLEQRIQRVLQEEIAIVPYDPRWPQMFLDEKQHLLSCLPNDLIRRIEHFGSTAVPGLAAKPIVDMLAEVADLEAAKLQIAPLLEAQGYDYFWRPTHGDHGPPFYAWFIKRDPGTRARTHHIHMVGAGPEFTHHWNQLLFRDYLIEHPEVAREYERLKLRLASEYRGDRVAYTNAKTEFVVRVTEQAKQRNSRKRG